MRNSKFKLHISLLLAIVILGGFFRFYRISEYMTFLGDEGRDVLVVKRIIVDHKFTLLGPTTSVGSMYMGPVYYYLMIPFLWLWNFDPVGPSVMVALFAIASMTLLYLVGARFFDAPTGLVAAFLYGISPIMIVYGRSSWNPNVVPFFSIFLMWSLLQVVVRKKWKWFVVVGGALGILIQLHYVTLLFFPIIASCLWLIRFRMPLKYYLLGVAGLILTYFPFLLFELRHEFVNSHAVIRFLSEQSSSGGSLFTGFWHSVSDVFVRVFWRAVVIENAEWTKVILAGLVGVFFMRWKDVSKQASVRTAFLAVLFWFIIGVITMGVYQGVKYDYYFGSLFGAAFLLMALGIRSLWRFGKWGKVAACFVLAILTWFNISHNPLKIEPNNLLGNTRDISRFVFDRSEGSAYNFALIASKNSDHAYRYFLELWGNSPIVIEPPQVDPTRKTVTDKLLIVCEEKVCEPLGHPLWEIAGFGPAQITGEWKVSTARVFELKPIISDE